MRVTSERSLRRSRARRLSIAWVVYDGLEARSGGNIYDQMIVSGLRDAGDDVEVVAVDSKAPAVRAARDLERQLQSHRFDWVVIDELCFRPAAHLLRNNGRPRLFQTALLVHHFSAWEESNAAGTTLAREEFCAASVDLCLTTGEWARERLAATLGARIKKLFVVEPGADRLVARGALDERERSVMPRLLFIGGVSRRKGILELVDLVVRMRGAHLTIVGAAREPETMQALLELVRSSPHVEIRGDVSDVELVRELQRTDALILPSRLEGYGMVLTEALHFGVPVLACGDTGLPKAVVDGVNGRIFRFDELGSVIQDIATSPTLLEELRQGARRTSASLPSWTGQIAEFRKVLRASRTSPALA